MTDALQDGKLPEGIGRGPADQFEGLGRHLTGGLLDARLAG